MIVEYYWPNLLIVYSNKSSQFEILLLINYHFDLGVLVHSFDYLLVQEKIRRVNLVARVSSGDK